MKPFFDEADCDMASYGYCLTHSPGRSPYDSLSLAKANRLLTERGKVVYGRIFSDGVQLYTTAGETSCASHRALLINIEPIETEDTPEKVLEDLAKLDVRGLLGAQVADEIITRARKLLSKKAGL